MVGIELNIRKEIVSRLKQFQQPNNKKSWSIILLNVIGFIFSIGISIYFYNIHYLLTSIFWMPTIFFLGRFFIIEHDCGHNSFFTKKKYNLIIGRVSGMFISLPFELWKHGHDNHHIATNNLNKRDENPELITYTVDEFRKASILKKIIYVFLRASFTRLVIFPVGIYFFTKIPLPIYPKKVSFSILFNLLISTLLVGTVIVTENFLVLIFVYGIPLLIFNIFSSIIFYLQHQFEHTLWLEDQEWDIFDVALKGSSFLKFSLILNWFTGSIGFHHIHHLNAKIPFYNLIKSDYEINKLIKVKPVYISEIFKHLSYKLWDSKTKKLVSYRSIKSTD